MDWLAVALILLVVWLLLGSVKAVAGLVFWIVLIVVVLAAGAALVRFLNNRVK